MVCRNDDCQHYILATGLEVDNSAPCGAAPGYASSATDARTMPANVRSKQYAE